MKKKLLSFLMVASMVTAYFNFNIVSASDIVAISGTTLSSGYGKATVVDLGRAYPLEYITATSSNCSVMASNDRNFGNSAGTVENVALGKKIRSARYGGAGYLTHVATKANDGDSSTAFISTPPNMTDEDSLTIDLDGNYNIEYITVDNNRRDREVFVSKTEDFFEAVQVMESSQGRYDLNDGNYYRYVRVDFKATTNEANKHFYVFEIGVYANPMGDSKLTTAVLTKNGSEYVLTGEDKGKYYRYISAKSSSYFTRPVVTAYVKQGGFDALSKAKFQTDSNPDIAYRITDNDIKSKWYGDSVILDIGYCRKIEDIHVLGAGNVKISAYGDTEGTVMSTQALLTKNEHQWFDCNEKARYIKIEAIDKQVELYDVKAYSPVSEHIHLEKETYTDEEWNTADFSKVRLISDILPCDAVYYVSDTPDFVGATKVFGHLDKIISGRYVRTEENVEKIGILTYELPTIDLDNGVVTYDTEVYGKSENQESIVAKYAKDGRLISTDSEKVASGKVQTQNVAFDSSRLMVWDSLAGMKPIMAETEIEKVRSKPCREFYVSKNGSDENDGSEALPFATIERAQDEVRSIDPELCGDVIVHISEGVYNLSETLQFTKQDSGRGGFSVIYKGAGIGKTVVSGGVPVTNFTKNANGLWEAYLPDIDEAYALTVNGESAVLAHNETPITAIKAFANDDGYTYNGFVFDKSRLPLLTNPEDAYIHTTKSWIDVFIRGEDMWEESDGIYFELYPNYLNQAMDSVKMSTLPIDAGCQFTIENAYELLDTEGEFYFNKKTHMLYYKPRNGENILGSYAEVPVLEDLVKIKGRGVEDHIEGLVLDGISFENSTDLKSYRLGFITDQAQLVRTGMHNRGIFSATISIDYATNVTIKNCEIKNTQKGGISLGEGAVNCNILSNKIHNIGDGAVTVGYWWHNKIERHSDSKKEYDCAAGKPTWVSSGSSQAIGKNKALDFMSESRYYYWVSNETDIIRGEKPWYAIDLMEAYTISQIELYFPKSQRNFEVLVANKPDFSDAKLLKSVGNTYCSSLIVPGDAENKYRYIKLAKTTLEHFYINGIFARTPDVEYQKDSEELCYGNVIHDNYIDGTGIRHKAAPAITTYYTDGTKITNNSIFDSNYTAISSGWGWEFNTDSETNRNTLIANNHIRNFNLTAADGGGVYIMGDNPGSIVENNYIEQTVLPVQNYTNVGIYGESGLRFATIRDNVIEVPERDNVKSNYAIAFFQTNEEDCQAHNNYGTYINLFDGSGKGTKLERLIKYDAESKPTGVMSIIGNSGSSLE